MRTRWDMDNRALSTVVEKLLSIAIVLLPRLSLAGMPLSMTIIAGTMPTIITPKRPLASTPATMLGPSVQLFGAAPATRRCKTASMTEMLYRASNERYDKLLEDLHRLPNSSQTPRTAAER